MKDLLPPEVPSFVRDFRLWSLLSLSRWHGQTGLMNEYQGRYESTDFLIEDYGENGNLCKNIVQFA